MGVLATPFGLGQVRGCYSRYEPGTGTKSGCLGQLVVLYM